MTESLNQPIQPQTPAEAWGPTQHFQGMGDNVLFAYGTNNPSNHSEELPVKPMRTDRDYVPPTPRPSIPSEQPIQTASSRVPYRDEHDIKISRAERRAIGAQLARETGQAALANEVVVQPAIIDAVPSFDKPTVAPQPQAEAAPVKKELSDEAMLKIRTEADNKYTQVTSLGGSNEDAEAAASRVWKRYGL